MIVFNLACVNGHHFEGWFGSAADYESQHEQGMVSCPECNVGDVTRLPHAPYVSTGSSARDSRAGHEHGAAEHAHDGAYGRRQYANLEDNLARALEYVMANTEDVGTDFAEEARKIHYQESPQRKIRGSASLDEAQSLREEGIEVVALPLPPRRAGRPH